MIWNDRWLVKKRDAWIHNKPSLGSRGSVLVLCLVRFMTKQALSIAADSSLAALMAEYPESAGDLNDDTNSYSFLRRHGGS